MALCYLCGCAQTLFGSLPSAELSIALSHNSSSSELPQRVLAHSDCDSDVGCPLPDDVTYLTSPNVYGDSDVIIGKASVNLRKTNSKFEHQGIKIELIGRLEFVNCPEKSFKQFFHREKELAPPGELHNTTSFDFSFEGSSPPYESYYGINVQLKYLLRVTILRRFNSIASEREIQIQIPSTRPEVTRSVKTEIGIGNRLRVVLECNKWKYHLSDVINGSINFVSNETDISHVELQIIRREITKTPDNSSALCENETLVSHEILDGNPKTGVRVPIQVYLAHHRLTPTMRNIEDRFTVKYYLNLVIVDSEENTYFKQQEVTFYRKEVQAMAHASIPVDFVGDGRSHYELSLERAKNDDDQDNIQQ